MRLPSHEVHAWTDGSCDSRTRLGGWGALLRSPKRDVELYGGQEDTTNNQMELVAALETLASLRRSCSILVFSDSQYVVQGVNEWMLGWKKRGWVKSSGEEIANEAEWREMYDLTRFHKTDFRWVRGHGKDVGNCRADELANLGRKSITRNDK